MPLRPASRSRLPARFAPLAFSFYMATLVCFLICLALTALNTGLGAGYLGRVLHAYGVAWPVAFLGVLSMRPLVVWLVARTVRPG